MEVSCLDMFKKMFLFIPDHKYLLMVSCQLFESLKELLSLLGSAPWLNFSLTFDHSPEHFFTKQLKNFKFYNVFVCVWGRRRGGEDFYRRTSCTNIHPSP